MSMWIWALVLVVAVWMAHWGAEHLAAPLRKLRKQSGISVAAGGAFIGLAAASPEVGINITSAFRGVSDIGLGAMLGSNIVAIPMVVTTAYLATRKERLKGHESEHRRHRARHLLGADPTAVTVQALPYLGILAVVAALTLPAPLRGLQPIDGWIMLGAYLTYLTQAVLRGREQGQRAEWNKREIWLAGGGLAALAVGAYFIVRATENIVSALGISRILGGLFITAPMAMLPELFATWSVARSGQVMSAETSVIGDHAVTMTVAFFPLALVTAEVQDFRLFWVNMLFVALMPALYATFVHRSGEEYGFGRWEVATLVGTYLAYLIVMFFWVLDVL